MSTFKLHTLASAPAGALPILEAANKGLGFIPNLYAQLAEAPTALQAYKQIGALLEQSSLTPEEQQVVLITVSVENHCEYCVAAHSFLARNMVKVPADVISALRDGLPLTNAKLDALAAVHQSSRAANAVNLPARRRSSNSLRPVTRRNRRWKSCWVSP